MYPVVKDDKLCVDAKDDMRHTDQSELGLRSRAVMSADGTWMTRGHHSKNGTLSIELFFTVSISVRKVGMT